MSIFSSFDALSWLSLFAGEPEWVHKNQEGLFWFLTPFKGTLPRAVSIQIGDAIYLDVFVAFAVSIVLILFIIAIPIYALSQPTKSKQLGLSVSSLCFAFIGIVFVLVSSLTISRFIVIVWELIFVALLSFILCIGLIVSKIKKNHLK